MISEPAGNRYFGVVSLCERLKLQAGWGKAQSSVLRRQRDVPGNGNFQCDSSVPPRSWREVFVIYPVLAVWCRQEMFPESADIGICPSRKCRIRHCSCLKSPVTAFFNAVIPFAGLSGECHFPHLADFRRILTISNVLIYKVQRVKAVFCRGHGGRFPCRKSANWHATC